MRSRFSSTPARPGQALVEFAFVVTMMMLMTMAIIDLGRGVFYFNELSNAAREGARVGAVCLGSSCPAQICQQVVNEATVPDLVTTDCGSMTSTVTANGTVWTDGALTITVVQGTAPANGVPGNPDSVTLSYQFSLITPLLGNLVGNPLTLNAYSSMYVEN